MKDFHGKFAFIVLLVLPGFLAQAPVKTPKAALVTGFEIRVADEVKEEYSPQDYQQVAFNSKASALTATDDQHILLGFSIVDASGASQTPHQVIVRFTSPSKEATFVPTLTGKKYKLDVDLKSKSGLFDNVSGKYELSLIVGDVAIQPFQWVVADVHLAFSQSPMIEENFYATKPEIVHMFRQPEKRPPVFVSNVFGLIILGLFVVMLLLWARIGVSIANVSLSSLLFQFSLASLLYVEYLFYLGNDMFTTLRYLTWTTPFALYFGKRMLSNFAKLEEEEE